MNNDQKQSSARVGGDIVNAQPIAAAPQAQPVSRPYVATYPGSSLTNNSAVASPSVPVAHPFSGTPSQAPKATGNSGRGWRSKKLRFVVLALVVLMLVIVGGYAANTYLFAKKQGTGSVASKFTNIELPLDQVVNQDGLSLLGTRSLVINGELRANSGFIISPSGQPSNAAPGQIYFDQGSGQLSYYDGGKFIVLGSNLDIGTGLSNNSGTVSNAGVLSLQGQTGNVSLTAGPGIGLTGTTITNDGVLTVTSGNAGIAVTDDGAGNVTISSTNSGSVTTVGGTTGKIAKFTGVDTIADSLISESGPTVTVNGDLNVTGALSLGSALEVGNGGTGATSLAANGVLIGNGTGVIGSVTAGGPGQCLLSTGGAPAFGSCSGSSSVTSVDTLSGALTVANTTGVGSTITIDDASTTQKGIAQFNNTNFSTTGGNVNTIQNINTGASPTFANQTLTGDIAVNGGDITSSGALNITPGGTLTVGATGQILALQGNASTSLSATNAGNTTTLDFQSPTANVTYRLATATAGTYDICTTVGNCSGAASTLQTAYDAGNAILTTDARNIAFTLADTTTDPNFTITTATDSTGFTSVVRADGAGSADPAQLFLVKNNDIDRVLPVAVSVQSAGGGVTTAFDASGSNITNALAIGAHAITGTNFSVTGGGAVTAIGVNSGTGLLQGTGGLTISGATASLNASSNFATNINTGSSTGTVTIGGGSAPLVIDSTNFDVSSAGAVSGVTTLNTSGNITDGGDLAVNGGDITSSGALNITPGGALVVGATGQTTALQGSTTSITSSGAGNDITLTSADQIILNAGTTIELQDATNVTGDFATTGTVHVGTFAAASSTAVCSNAGVLSTCNSNPASVTLQQAYDAGNTISATDGRDIAFTLANTTTDPNFTITTATGGAGFTSILRADGAGTADPAQLLLVKNNDTDRVQPLGISVQAAAGGVTTAFDASGSNITNALAIGAHAITGTNFSVTSGGAVTAVGVNAGTGLLQGTGGLTVSGATASINANSNFATNVNTGSSTGTVTIGGGSAPLIIDSTAFDVTSAGAVTGVTTLNTSGNITDGGDIAVNGGDITSSGNLNITPTGTLTAGSTGQTLTLQGNASTSLSATNGGNSTTVNFQSPTAAVTYRFATAAAGAYDICTTVGNCSGAAATLQTAYDAGNSILTTDGRDVSLTLANTTTDPNFTITTATGATGFTSIVRADGAGTADPAQLLLVKNNDTDRVLPVGVSVQSAGGGITTAFDASGSNITNALAIGAHAITGTNFSVTGGGAVTAVGVNSGTGLIQGTGGLTVNGAAVSLNTSSNFNTSINTGTSTGTVTIGGGSAPLVIDSTNFDVSSAGAVSGVTTLNTSGVITVGALGASTSATSICRNGSNQISSCSGAGGTDAAVTLQNAYANGNTISTTDARDINLTLADTTTDGNFTITTATGSTGFSSFLRADGAGTNDPAQLVLVKNNDIDRVQPLGISVQAAAGGITTAFDASGSNITNALAIGAHAITGTNFSVTGGGAVTAVGVNAGAGLLQGALGLTISGATASINNNSNFSTNINTGTSTGTVTIGGGSSPLVIDSTNFDVSSAGAVSGVTTLITSGNITDGGDIAVNGGDITSSGALNITPGGSLVVGAAAKSLTLQGNASTTITATDSGNTTSLVFETPTANVNYHFRTVAAGDYDVCTTIGNCSGSGSSNNLQAAYDAGNTILTTDGRDIAFTLANTTTDPNLTVTTATGSTGSTSFLRADGAGTADPSQLVLVKNNDLDRVLPVGISVQSAAGGITTAYDASGSNITNALAIGAHAITGTNFSVTGGGAVTAVGVNSGTGLIQGTGGLTVSGAAISLNNSSNFNTSINTGTSTGTVTIGGGSAPLVIDSTNFDVSSAGAVSGVTTLNTSGNITDGGDIAVNGGDITSSGALNITPGGTLTAGSAGQTFTLQGDAGSTIKSSDSGNTTTVSFAVPTANVTYRFATAASNTYDICTTAGNCFGSGTGSTLQAAYDAGSTISTTDARNIAFTLADSTTDSNFSISTATGSTGFTSITRADGAGTADPAQLLLVKNNDTDRVLPVGISVQAAAGGVTTAIDASGSNITNALAIGTHAITGTNFSVTGGGAVTAVGVNSGTGLIQGTGGATLSGATISLNASSNFATNINTGTSTGTITLGGGSSPLVIDSTNFDVSSAGAVSGVTTLNTSGVITVGALGANTSSTSICRNGSNQISTCSGSGGTDAAVTLQNAYANGNSIATTDGRDVTLTLADTTTDPNFTITTATGSTGFTSFLRADGAGTADPAQLVLVKNNDTDRVQPLGVSVQAAAGGITTAFDASGSNITNALAIGAHAITGTNFSVTGGGAVTAVGVNAGAGLLQGALGLTITGATTSLNASSNFATNINTGTSTGTVTIGGGSAPLVIDSTHFDVSSAGAVSGATTINASSTITGVGVDAGAGLLQGAAGLTVTGAAVSLNASSNFATSINTGTSTGTITLGGGSAPLVIDSTNFDVSSAGAVGGVTTLATSGIITVGALGANTSATSICRNGSNQISTCSGSGGTDAAVTLQNAYANGNSIATTDGRDFTLTLADTTTDPNFTVTTATGSTGFTSFLRADGAGTSDPSQLVLVKNNDTDRVQPLGVSVQAAAGGITTAFDASGSNITNALAIGAHAITGTNFSVTGGGAVTAVGVNSGTGLIQGTGGATLSGATISLNAGSNFATNINTGSSTGTVTIGGGSAPLVIDSTNFDVSSAGAVSGVTTLSTSGIITDGTLGASTGAVGICRNSSNQISSCSGSGGTDAAVTLQNAYANGNTISTSSNDIAFTLNSSQGFTTTTAAGGTGFTTFALADGANATPPAQLVLVKNNDTNQAVAAGVSVQAAAGTITTAFDASGANITNALAIGAHAITGTNFSVTGGGAVTAVGVNSGAGLLQGALGLTVTGAAVSLNASSNFATNINTGSSTGTVTIGGGSSPLAIDSTNFDVSSAGAVSGVTTLSTSGIITVGALGANTSATSICRNGSNQISSCSGSGGTDAAVTLQNAYANGNSIATTDGRDVTLTLADTTTDPNFTITTATGSTGFTSILRADGAGTSDPAQLLLVKNNDTDRVQPLGISVQAAAGGITTAFDASGSNITNALAIGAHAITGTNFSVTGGGAVTAVGVNSGAGLLQGALGLTITGAATSLNASSNFATNINTGTSTGTVTIGGGSAPLVIDSTNFDVSSAGALSGITTINTSGAITVGALGANTSSTSICRNGSNQISSCSGAGGIDAAVTLQNVYNNSASTAGIVLSTTNDGLLIQNPASSGTDSGYALKVDQVATGAVDGLQINNVGTGVGASIVSANTGVTGNVLLVQSNTTGVVTNGLARFNFTGAHTGNGVQVDDATASGNGVAVTTNSLTTGKAVTVTSTNTGLTSGSLLYVSSATTGAVATNGIVSLNATGNYTSTSNAGLLSVLANSTAAGTIVNISGTSLTSGTALNIAANTGTAINVSSGLTSLTAPSSGSGAALTVSNSTSTGSILLLKDNTTAVMSIADGGAAIFQNSADSTAAFVVQASGAGGNVFTVDTSNSRAGINVAGAPSLATTGLEINGALKLSGTGTDHYVTPLGVPVPTKINIPNFDPGAFGQLLALGLPVTAQDSARAITVLDARTTDHRPTISVLSPNENNEFGLTWAGSNTEAFLKTATVSGNSIDIAVKTGDSTNSSTTTGTVFIISGDGLGTGASSGNVTIDTGAKNGAGTSGTINIGATNSPIVNIGRIGSTSTNIQAGGTVTLRSNDTATGVIQIGDGGVGSATPDYLALDIKSTTGDPSGGVEGEMYYNTFDNKFRCFQGAGWTDCIGSGGSTDLQTAYNNSTSTASIVLSSTDDGLLVQNPASSGTDSGYTFKIDQVATGAVDGLQINNVGTGVGASIVSANTGVTGNVLLAQSNSTGVVTNGLARFNFTGAHTGNGVQVDDATASGNAVAITTNSLTTGNAVTVTSTNTGLTSGSLLNVSSATTGAVATNGIVSLNATGNYTSTSNIGLLSVLANSTAAGTVQNIQANALTTGNALRISSTGAGLTTGSLVYVTSATTGAVNTNGIVSLNATGNYTSTSNNGLLNVLANSTAAGTIVNISGTSLTSGTALNIAANTGTAINVSSGLTSLTAPSSGSGVAFTVGNSTSTGSIAVFKDNSTTVATIADGGAATFQNSTDSTAGFNVKTSSGANVLSADTTNNIVTTNTLNTGTLSGARLFTDGFEGGTFGLWNIGSNISGTSTASIDSTVKRNGAYSAKFTVGTGNDYYRATIPTTAGRAYSRFYVNISAASASVDLNIFDFRTGVTGQFSILRMHTNGHIAVYDNVNVTHDTGTVLTTGSWHKVELITSPVVSQPLQVYLDDTLVGNYTTGTNLASFDNVAIGDDNNSSGSTMYIDDLSVDAAQTPGTNDGSLMVQDSLHVSGTSTVGQLFITATADATALKVLNAAANATDFAVDTAANTVKIGDNTGTGTSTTTFVLDTAASGTPTAVAGGMYYLTGTGFRCSDGATWSSCGGAGTWDTIGDPAGNGAIAFGSTVQTMDWATMNGNNSLFSFNFTNTGGSAGTDNGVVINNAVSSTSTGDQNTEALLLLQQLDTTTSGTTVVDAALKIDAAASSGITDGINVTNSAGNITNGIDLVDTAGGTFAQGVNLSGTFTNGIDFNSSTTTADIRKDTTGFILDMDNASNSTFTVTNAGAGISSISIDAGGSYTSAGAVTLSSTSADLTVTTSTSGNIVLQPSGSGTTANVLIGAGAGGAGSTTPDLFALDIKSTTGNPTGFDGAMYYNKADGKFRCYQGGWSDCLTAGGAGTTALSGITAATGTNTIANGSNNQSWNWGSLTTQTGMTFGGGTAMTTGSVFAVSNDTFNHGNTNETGQGLSVVFTDATNGTATSNTYGIRSVGTLNVTTGASGTKTLAEVSTGAPILTACTGGSTCNVKGLEVNTATTGFASAINNYGIDIIGTGISAGTLTGVNIGNITGGAGTETAINIGTGWDTGINVQSGQIITSNQGVEFTESDTNPTCAAGNYNIYADLSETKLKKCVNGVVSDLDAGTKYETFTSNGTYTKPSDAIMVIVEAWGAGGGGGGGAGGSTAAARTGGGGGGGGAFVTGDFSAADLGSSVPVTVGTAGTAGTAGSGAAGGNGGAGGDSCFSTTTACSGTMILRAFGGGFGAGTGTAGNGGGGGGGSQSAGGNASTVNFGSGGGPLGGAATTSVGNDGNGGGNGTTSIASPAAGGAGNFGGGGGGASSTTGASAGSNGGASTRGGGAGGAGGSCAITTCTPRAGGAGGATGGGIVAGGTAGSSAGGAGGAGNNGTTIYGGSGGGGGGTNASGTGGAGNNGGAPAGGGGGGGAGETTTGGAGGAGGRGEVRIWSVKGNGADLAEIYGSRDTLQPGDVVCLDTNMRAGVKKCSNPYDSGAMGIITTTPGLVIGNIEDAGANVAPVVLTGRTPVKVSSENGPILAGDLLTASSTPGVAMKATKAGQVIGQAMAPFSGSGTGMTVVFVKTNFSHGSSIAGVDNADGKAVLAYLTNEQNTLSATTSQDLSAITTDRLVAGLSVTTPQLTASKVATDSLEGSTSSDITVKLGSDGKVNMTNTDGKVVSSFDATGNASIGLDLNVGGSISVDGPAKFHGSAFFYNMVTFVEKTVFNNDLSLNGHLLTDGETPTANTEPAAGPTTSTDPTAALASTNIHGNDNSGQLGVTIGQDATAGKVVTVKFHRSFDKAPQVLLTPGNDHAATAGYYVETTKDGFTITTTSAQPVSTLQFNYWVVGSN